MTIVVVIGTRPQIIKTAPILREAEARGFKLKVVHTGQHYDYEMSRVFFNELDMPSPVVNLGVGSGSHGLQTGQMLMGLEKVYLDLKPDIVLVPGDTNSTLAGAIAAAKIGIPVAHVEAGCRSFDMNMPEEINRRLTDHCSSILFAVSEWSRDQLLREGIDKNKITLVGDTMYEGIQHHRQEIDKAPILDDLGINEKFYVMTVHRAENTDDNKRLMDIFETLLMVDNQVIFPCHPRTEKRLQGTDLMRKIAGSQITLVKPVGYYSMLKLISEAKVVLTDSGGVQKEAFWMGTPCVTLRDNTEWTETIELGMNKLVGANPEKIFQALREMENKSSRPLKNPYNFNGASSSIISELERFIIEL
jgi:UDP-N-acetylglucosamine 2-epimerase